ncbi:hypothetical protein FRC12_019316 [Ceratobasidium sp. 428]|nr:hypothetical protein FRC12_019316 [Ceratobasidium sp. 428]
MCLSPGRNPSLKVFCVEISGNIRTLPNEIIERICAFLFTPPSTKSHDDTPVISHKPPWSDVSGFMNASPGLHAMGFAWWMRVLKVRGAEDWELMARSPRLSHWVFELVCLDGAFIAKIPELYILDRFNHLCALSIDAHRDLVHDDSSQFRYRNLITALPTSLRRLEILRAHGPDIGIIAAVQKYCPDLEDLRLGRCTMFNQPACQFWKQFPNDHDSYFSNRGIEGYACTLARELRPLRALKHLKLGMYLMPADAVCAHRFYHTKNMPMPPRPSSPHIQQRSIAEPSPWSDEAQLVSLYNQLPEKNFGPTTCEFCLSEFFQASRAAESRANTILRALLPKLSTIEWMDWFSDSHLGVSRYVEGVASTSACLSSKGAPSHSPGLE